MNPYGLTTIMLLTQLYMTCILYLLYSCPFNVLGTFLVIQWFRFHTPNAGGPGLIPDQGTNIPRAMQCGQKIK